MRVRSRGRSGGVSGRCLRPGLSAHISTRSWAVAALCARARSETAAIPIAFGRKLPARSACKDGCQGGVSFRTPCRAQPPLGSVRVERIGHLLCCPIVPHVLPPPTLRILRCAPARGGYARRRAGATVAQTQPTLRPAQAQTQAPIGPCARTTRPAPAPSSTNPPWLWSARVTQQDITSGRTAPIASTRSSRRSS